MAPGQNEFDTPGVKNLTPAQHYTPSDDLYWDSDTTWTVRTIPVPTIVHDSYGDASPGVTQSPSLSHIEVQSGGPISLARVDLISHTNNMETVRDAGHPAERPLDN